MVETPLPNRVEQPALVPSIHGAAPPLSVAAPPAVEAHPDAIESARRMAAERIVEPLGSKPKGKTVVLFALDQESRPFIKRDGDRKDIDIRTSGMGRKNAEAAMARILANGRPRRVITAGLAGALRPDLEVGDIVFETTDPAVAKRLVALGAKPAKFMTTELIIATTAADKRRLRAQTGADVIENESGYVQAICRARDVPCTTIRVISDVADEDMPFDFNQLEGADGNVDYRKVMAALAREPWKLPAVLRLWNDTHTATNSLSTFLEKVLPVAGRRRPPGP